MTISGRASIDPLSHPAPRRRSRSRRSNPSPSPSPSPAPPPPRGWWDGGFQAGRSAALELVASSTSAAWPWVGGADTAGELKTEDAARLRCAAGTTLPPIFRHLRSLGAGTELTVCHGPAPPSLGEDGLPDFVGENLGTRNAHCLT